jgi:hypothetical protein
LQQNMRARLGVSTVVIVIAVILIVAAGGITGYFLLTSRGPSSAQTTGAMTSSTYLPPTTSVSSQMAETSNTTTAISATSSVNSLYLPSNSTQIFGLFSAMTIQLSATSSSSNQTEGTTMSFQKVGSEVVNGVPTTEVNFTYSSNTGSNSSIALFYASNGTVVSASVGGMMFNGTNARPISSGVLDIFNLFLGYNGYFQNPAYYSQLAPTGTSTQTFGQVTMDVTTYTATSVTFGGNSYGSVTVSIGKLPSSNYSMVVYFKASGTTAQGSGTATFQLISATPA